MDKITVFLLVFLLIFMPIIYAQDVQTLGQIKLGDSILLKQNCVNVTYANITSISVNGLISREQISNPISMSLISNGYQTYLYTNSTVLGQYIVTGICDEAGIVKPWSYNYEVTPSGETLTTVQISTYLFFLFLCLVMTFFSVRLFQINKMSKDEIKGEDMYKEKKRNEFLFYMSILKRKLWIVGVFGVYLSLLIFSSLLSQLVYNLGLNDLHNTLKYIPLFFMYGIVPFVLFWFVYIVIVFWKTTTDTMRYQFGVIGSGGRKR